MKKRDKLEKKFKYYKFIINEEELLNKPITDRTVEKYINPFDEGWQVRYYRELFDLEYIEDNIKDKFV